METIADRLKIIRNESGADGKKLSQAEFGKRIGITQTGVASYETGQSNVSDRVIETICREFNVNERWLRTGEGPMFRPQTGDDQLMAALGDIALGEDSFRRRFIAALATMPPENWKVLEALLRKTLEEEDKKEET